MAGRRSGLPAGVSQLLVSPIARIARRRGTGARGLRSVIEDLMRDIIFEISEQPLRGIKVVVDEQRVLALGDASTEAESLRLERFDSDTPASEAAPEPDAMGPEDGPSSGETAARLKPDGS